MPIKIPLTRRWAWRSRISTHWMPCSSQAQTCEWKSRSWPGTSGAYSPTDSGSEGPGGRPTGDVGRPTGEDLTFEGVLRGSVPGSPEGKNERAGSQPKSSTIGWMKAVSQPS